MHLEEISTESYQNFIDAKIEEQKIICKNDVIPLILEWTKRHTFYVQYLCNKIVSSERKQIDKEVLKQIFHEILQENEAYYFEYRNLLTSQQWKLITAIAKESGVNKISGSSFIRKHNLSNPSTVRRGINALLEKELIYKKGEIFYVYDVFFSRWLERR